MFSWMTPQLTHEAQLADAARAARERAQAKRKAGKGATAASPRARPARRRPRGRDVNQPVPARASGLTVSGGKTYVFELAEDEGFEPSRACTQHAFQVCRPVVTVGRRRL